MNEINKMNEVVNKKLKKISPFMFYFAIEVHKTQIQIFFAISNEQLKKLT